MLNSGQGKEHVTRRQLKGLANEIQVRIRLLPGLDPSSDCFGLEGQILLSKAAGNQDDSHDDQCGTDPLDD